MGLVALVAIVWVASRWRSFKGEKMLRQDLARIREALADPGAAEVLTGGTDPQILARNDNGTQFCGWK